MRYLCDINTVSVFVKNNTFYLIIHKLIQQEIRNELHNGYNRDLHNRDLIEVTGLKTKNNESRGGGLEFEIR